MTSTAEQPARAVGERDHADRGREAEPAPVTRFAGLGRCAVEPDAPCLRVLGYDEDTDGGRLGFTPGGQEGGGVQCRSGRSGCSPGPRRDPPGRRRRARPGRCGCAPCAPGSAAAPRPWSSAARCRADQHERMRAPHQDGDFPGPVKYGYLNVGVVEAGDAGAGRADGVLPAPAPDGVRRPGRRRDRRARRRPAARAVLAGHRRDRGQRALGRGAAWSATGSPWSAPGWSAAAWPGCWPAIPGVEVTLVDVDPTRAEVAAALGVALRPPGRGARRPRPGRARERDRGRAAALAGAAGAGRRGGRPELVRRHPGPARPRRRLPLRPAADPRQPGRRGGAAPPAPPDPRRAAGARARPAPRPGLRRAAHRRLGLRGAARR